jgi:TRAP-type C4-dicarboxylate transport system permease small subunit
VANEPDRAAPQAPARRSIWERIESGPVLTFATALTLFATAIMVSEGFNRSVFSVSFFWAEESVRYLMIWAFVLTLGTAGRQGHHIRTELLVDAMPPRVRRAMNLLALLAGVAFSAVLLASSLPQLQRYYTMGMVSESNLDLPTWIVFLAMPIGAALYLMYYLGALGRALRGADPFAPAPGAPTEPQP